MRNTISIIKNVVILTSSLLYYAITKKPTVKGHQSMIILFCRTSGLSSDLMAKTISLFHRPHKQNVKSYLFGEYSAEKIQSIADQIAKNGYIVLDEKLPPNIIDKATNLVTHLKADISSSDMFDAAKGENKQNILFDRNDLRSVRYTYFEEDLIKSQVIQEILGDPFFAAVSESYLQSEPILDSVHLSWSTNYSKIADEKAAQKFHFDMERIKWLKVFVYLTDTDYSNGPHCFVKGSHKSHGIPTSLLKRGYARIEDHEVAQCYSSDRILEFVGKKGTIIIEDTRGLHKGKNLSGDPRLLLQFEFTNSLFGCLGKKPLRDVHFSKEVLENIKNYPKLLNQFI